MSSAVQRYIEEEFGDIEEQPVYLPGDKIGLRLQTVHEVNLGNVWAIFRKLPGRGEPSDATYITFPGKHYPLSQAGAVRASEVYFEVEISRDQHLPGGYELEAVRAYPYELDGREDLIMEFEVRGEIRFRIAEEPDTPSPRVTAWKFSIRPVFGTKGSFSELLSCTKEAGAPYQDPLAPAGTGRCCTADRGNPRVPSTLIMPSGDEIWMNRR